MHKKITVLLVAACFAAHTKANAVPTKPTPALHSFTTISLRRPPTGHGPLLIALQGRLSYTQGKDALRAIIGQDWTTTRAYFRNDIQGFSIPEIRTYYLRFFTYLDGGNPDAQLITVARALEMIQQMQCADATYNVYATHGSVAFYDGGTDGTWQPTGRTRFLWWNSEPVIDLYCLNPIVPLGQPQQQPEPVYQQEYPQEADLTYTGRVGLGGGNSNTNSNTNSPVFNINVTGGGTGEGVVQRKNGAGGYILAAIGGGILGYALTNSRRQPVYSGGYGHTNWPPQRRVQYSPIPRQPQGYTPPTRRYNTSTLNSQPARYR